jgi:conjugative transposon TraK protein
MEFKSLKNIESSFRQIRLFGIVFLSLCAVVTVWSVWNSYRFAEKQREKIYVLDNGKSLMLALSQDLSQNRPAEAREHVRRFHELFFTLSPEKSAIEHNVKRALLLADKSVYNYYSDFAEKGYYNRIIAGNINQVLKVDSVVCDFNGLSLPCRDLRHTENHPAEQRHRAQPRDHLPPAERVPFGRQPQRFHHRGLHHHREQGFTNHQKVTGHEKSENQCGCVLEAPRQTENAGGKAQRVSGRLAAENTQAASCWGCSPPSRCLPSTPSAEPSMTSAGTTAARMETGPCRTGGTVRTPETGNHCNTLFIWNRRRMNRRKRTRRLPTTGKPKKEREAADRGPTAETSENDSAARYGAGIHRGDVADIRPVLRQGAATGNGWLQHRNARR